MIKDPHKHFYRRAVILFNLGGPGSLDDVAQFLFNLFYDKSIITLPNPFRYLLARTITACRKNTAKEIYRQLGGSSPILPNTLLQADALQKKLSQINRTYHDVNIDHRVFVAMRYSEPMPASIIEQVYEYDPQDIVLLPLYPQYSTTTTGSFIDFWQQAVNKAKLHYPTIHVKEYCQNDNFIKAHCLLIEDILKKVQRKYKNTGYRLLFSAHGLPQSIIDKGDPYEQQIIRTVKSITKKIGSKIKDHAICYQSKVGPKKWLEPSIKDAIMQASKDKLGVMVIPISFVSEHSETLIELDVEYRELATSLALPFYVRVPTLDTSEHYIKCLEELVLQQPISQ